MKGLRGYLCEVDDGGGSDFPLSKDSSRMVSTQEFVPRDSMSASNGSTAEFCNAGTTSKSPKSSVAETNHEIRIEKQNFFTQSIQFILEFLSAVFGGEEWAVAGDAFGLGSAKELQPVRGGMLLEDVASVEFGMIGPDLVDQPRVVFFVVAREEKLIGEGKR